MANLNNACILHGKIRYACTLHGELSNACILHGELSNTCILHGKICKACYICTTYESLTAANILLGYETKVTLNIISIAF